MSVANPIALEPLSESTVIPTEDEAKEDVVSRTKGVEVVVTPTVFATRTSGHQRPQRRQCNVLISTRHLSRLNLLFWQTDHRNTATAAASSVPMTRKRKRQINPTTLSLGRIVLQRVHDSPHIYIIENFLSEAELAHCDAIIQKSKFQKSFVDAIDRTTDSSTRTTKTRIDKEHRTSTFVSLTKQADCTVASIERKAADLLGLSADRMEPLQLVRYQTDQFFGIHHDCGNLQPDGEVELPLKQAFCKRRLVTIFCYLNTVQEGGSTFFPALGKDTIPMELRVAPLRGRAVMFCNVLKEGQADPRTVHAGEPVRGKNGTVKYGLNIWACEE